MPKVQVTLPNDDRFSGEVIAVDVNDIDGGSHLVRAADVRKNYVEKAFMQETIDERLAGQAANLKGQLASDPAFVKQILSQHGVNLDAEGKIVYGRDLEESAINEALASRLEAEKNKWMETDLQPLSEQAKASEQKLTTLQRQLLHLETLEAARAAGVRSELFEVLPGARREAIPVIAQTEHMFGIDESGFWAVKAEDGNFLPSESKTPDRPHASPAEYFAKLKENEAAKGWFKEERMSGPGVNGTDTKNASGDTGQASPTERMKYLRSAQNGQFR